MAASQEQQLDLIQQLLIDLNDKVEDVGPRLLAIEIDLREHMRRTELLEADVKHLNRSESVLKGGILALGAIGISALIKLFH